MRTWPLVTLGALLLLLVGSALAAAPAAHGDGPSLAPNLDAISTALGRMPPRTAHYAASPVAHSTCLVIACGCCVGSLAPAPAATVYGQLQPPTIPTPTPAPATPAARIAAPVSHGAATVARPQPPTNPVAPAPHTPSVPNGCGSTCGGGGVASVPIDMVPVTGP